MKKKLLALKPYLETVETHCSRLSKQEIAEVILGLARAVPSGQRPAFLDTIDRLSREHPPVVVHEEILKQIEALKGEIRERIVSIEDGTYYEDHYQEERRCGSQYYDDYDDEFPDTLSEDQTDELESLFEKAAQLFLSGQLAAAREVYAALFRLLEDPNEEGGEADYSISDYALDVEMREARARYCRCVYETTPLPERAAAVLAAMNPQARLIGRFDVYKNHHPMLSEVMDCLPGELPEWEQFLPQWGEELGRHSSDRADMLLLEAVHLLEGLEGVGSQVRGWADRQPRAWLFWIRLLALDDDWNAVAGIAEEALAVVTQHEYRALVAEKLVEAGAKINRPELVLKGKRETFLALPEESHLLRLIEEADRQNLKDEELEGALAFISSKKKTEETLLVKLLLMTGRMAAAFDQARDIRALGWSYGESAGAVLFGAVLSLLCLDRMEAAVTIQSVLRRYADSNHRSYVIEDNGEEEAEDRTQPETGISEEILKGLRRVNVSEDEKNTYMKWALKIGRRRIEQIVSNQHRGAYDRAAEVLGALAECFLLNGEEENSRRIIDEYRNQRFNRYSAFRRELDSLIDASGLLHRQPPAGS